VYYNGSVLHKWTRDGQPLSIYTFVRRPAS